MGGFDLGLRYAAQLCAPGAARRLGRYGYYGPHAGERPASMWQWPAFADIIAKPDWKTFAFHQGNLGAGYPKPTRLLVFAKDRFALPSFCYEGPPSFDNQGFYLGPLPMAKGMGSIWNRQSQGPFKTSGSEMWPAKMCQWISTMLLSSWASSATTASKGVPDSWQCGGAGERGLPRGSWWRGRLPASQGPALHQGPGRYVGQLDRGPAAFEALFR